ncbi:MAG: small basic protein [Candidatus Omnitrophota bacterium]
MSIHPSLGVAVKGKQQKSVLKRADRIKHLMKKGLWKEESKVFGLPKIKAVRIKVKKEVAEKPAEGAAAAAGKPATAAAPAQKTKAAPKK